MPKKVTTEEFNNIIKSNKVVLVDFSAAWCGPCQMMAPVVEDNKKEYEKNDKVEIIAIDIDENPEIAAKYPGAIFIGGQLIFGGNNTFSRLLHNYTIFAIQRKLYRHGMTTIVIPIPLEIDHFNSNQNFKSLKGKQYGKTT